LQNSSFSSKTIKNRPRLSRFKRGFLWGNVAGMVEFTTFFGQKHTPKSLGSFCLRFAPGATHMAHLRCAGGWFLWRLCGIVMGMKKN